MDETATIGSDCKIGPNVSIGALCKIGNGVRLSNCVLLHRVEVGPVLLLPCFVTSACTILRKSCTDACVRQNSMATPGAVQIKNYARVADSIVGWGSRLGTWSRLENHSVIGEDVFVRDEVLLNGAIVLPHKVRPCLFTNAHRCSRTA